MMSGIEDKFEKFEGVIISVHSYDGKSDTEKSGIIYKIPQELLQDATADMLFNNVRTYLDALEGRRKELGDV